MSFADRHVVVTGGTGGMTGGAEGTPASGGDVPAEAAAGYQTTVTMAFEPQGENRTLVTIAEEGWRQTERGLQGSYGNCQGWAQMLCAMKVLLEHGINLREGFYK